MDDTIFRTNTDVALFFIFSWFFLISYGIGSYRRKVTIPTTSSSSSSSSSSAQRKKSSYSAVLDITAVSEEFGFEHVNGSDIIIDEDKTWYESVVRPRVGGAPPSYLFGFVWPVLYFLLSVSFFLYYRGTAEIMGWEKDTITILITLSIIFNKMWHGLFFKQGRYGMALLNCIATLVTTFIVWCLFVYLKEWASMATLIPYLLWCAYASYLNAAWCWVDHEAEEKKSNLGSKV